MVKWDLQPLGLVPDGYLARTLGVNQTTVTYQRRARGIPALPAGTRGGYRGFPPPHADGEITRKAVINAVGRVPKTSAEIHSRVSEDVTVGLNRVRQLLTRLTGEGLLARQMEGDAYTYTRKARP